MGEQTQENRILSYITWGIFLLFSGFMLLMSITTNWDTWIKIYAPASAFLITCITFTRRISGKVHSFFFVTLAMGNIFVYSYAQKELYPIIVIISCLSIVSAVFMNTQLLFLLLILTVLFIFLHIFLLGTVDLTSMQDLLPLCIRIFALLFGEIFLILLINRQNTTEDALKISLEKAQKAEQSKAEFLANMSHEIRTPMNVIIGMCELILREDINDTVRENCQNIKSSSRNLLSIINDILDFSKIDAGKIDLIEEEFDITSIVNDIINTADARKEDKPIELVARIDPSIPKGLMGDEFRIKQIIINLITNAIKFTHAGYVSLKIAHKKTDYGIDLEVAVTDTGIGITEENLKKLFTSFQQVDTKKNRAVEGTGLGLAISKRLVEQMNGEISVTSTYGKGSTFQFMIPLKITNPEPFIQVNTDKQLKVGLYLDKDKYTHPDLNAEYRMMIGEVAQNFRLDIRPFGSPNELYEAVQKEKFTHCFTAQEEYKADSSLFNLMAYDVPLYVMKDRTSTLELPEHIRCIYKPFYSLSVAAVLNNQKRLYDVQNKNDNITYFTAPKAKILLVDDNAINLKVAEGLMKPYNLNIHAATSGPDAIKLLDYEKYDIIFMDHMMPGMDGVETTAAIRQMDGDYFKKVPIIALTANAVNGAKENFLDTGFDDFIAKPIELSVLNRVLRKWLPADMVIHTPSPAEIALSNTPAPEAADTKAVTDSVRTSSGNIQYETGIGYAGNSEEIYHTIMEVYVQKGSEYKSSLENRFATEDWKNYVIEVHALKSSSVSIGATELSARARELEFAGKDGNYELIKEKHPALIALYEAVLSEAADYLRKQKQEA